MYCQSRQRHRGKSFEELFPDELFPNDTPRDHRKSKMNKVFIT